MRLGSGPTDAEEIKQGHFFADINWEALMNGQLPPPWEPTVTGSLDTSQFDREFTSMPIMSPDSKENALGSHDTTFAGFTFTEQSTLAEPDDRMSSGGDAAMDS